VPISELVAVDTYIYSRLTAAPALLSSHVYAAEAPQSQAAPYIVYALMGGFDDLTEVGAVRIWANLLYLVKVVGQGTSFAALDPTVTEIDARLHRTSGPVSTTAYVDSCIREQPFRMAETTPSGVAYRHAGGLYRLRVRLL